MLYRVIIDNYKSFAEETAFDLFPNPKRETFPNHVYGESATPVLKSTAIYGANGAGKSNLIKGMQFIKEFTTTMHRKCAIGILTTDSNCLWKMRTSLSRWSLNLKTIRKPTSIA